MHENQQELKRAHDGVSQDPAHLGMAKVDGWNIGIIRGLSFLTA